MAKGCAERLAGTDMPKWGDDEETFADVHCLNQAINWNLPWRHSKRKNSSVAMTREGYDISVRAQ